MKYLKAFLSVLSILYLIYGILQFYNGVISWWIRENAITIQLGIRVGNTYIPNIFPEPFSGICLIVIGFVFMKSLYLYCRGDYRYKGFLFIGWMLSLMMLALNIIVLLADVLDAYYPAILGGEISGWTLESDPWGIAPHSILGLIALPLYYEVRDMIKELIPG